MLEGFGIANTFQHSKKYLQSIVQLSYPRSLHLWFTGILPCRSRCYFNTGIHQYGDLLHSLSVLLCSCPACGFPVIQLTIVRTDWWAREALVRTSRVLLKFLCLSSGSCHPWKCVTAFSLLHCEEYCFIHLPTSSP